MTDIPLKQTHTRTFPAKASSRRRWRVGSAVALGIVAAVAVFVVARDGPAPPAKSYIPKEVNGKRVERSEFAKGIEASFDGKGVKDVVGASIGKPGGKSATPPVVMVAVSGEEAGVARVEDDVLRTYRPGSTGGRKTEVDGVDVRRFELSQGGVEAVLAVGKPRDGIRLFVFVFKSGVDTADSVIGAMVKVSD
jgi:hypothetical protein